MRGLAEVTLEMEDPTPIYQALLPEAKDQQPRSRIFLDLKENTFKLVIEGDDIVSLRAAFNTWIRLVKIALEMVSA